MTGIDEEGNESGCAAPQFAGRRFFGKLATDTKSIAHAAEEAVQRNEPTGRVRPFPTRCGRGFWPVSAIAVGPEDELFLLSRGVCGVCVEGQDSREVLRLGEKGSGGGQLNAPSDPATVPAAFTSLTQRATASRGSGSPWT